VKECACLRRALVHARCGPPPLQFVDLYTHNFAYVGSRSTGQEGGAFLLAGPRWKGDAPNGISGVFRSETELALVTYRTQLFAPGDLEDVKKIQAGYNVQPLSAFFGIAAPPAAPPIDPASLLVITCRLFFTR
jgi:hypothetical protein